MQDQSLVVRERINLEREFFKDGMTSDMIKLLDRVEKKLADAFAAGYKMANMIGSQEWSNNACYGYAILSAKEICLPDQQIRRLINAMKWQHDMKSLSEATTIYENSPY